MEYLESHGRPARRAGRHRGNATRWRKLTVEALAIGSLIAAVVLGSSPLALAAPSGSDNVLSLNGTWQFAYAASEAETVPLQSFYAPGYAAQAFQPTPVPSNWALQGYAKPAYKKIEGEGGQGFYLHRFTVPKTWSDRRVRLHFGGVWDSAEVWLNGTRLGRHDSGFTSFAYDATEALKPGTENLLAVRVRETVQGYEFDTNDDWTIGGIYRDVTLEAMPKDRWIDKVEVQTTFDDQFQNGELKVRVMVGDTNKSVVSRNYVGPGEPYVLRLSLLARDGKSVQSEDLKVSAHYGTGREITAVMRVIAPHKWTAETPNLYTLQVDLLENGKLAHERAQKVGFRQISTAGGVFRINGQAIKLRGVNRHDEHPDVGRATTRAQWLEDLQLMKAANINYIRLAHYPPAEGFLDLCDEMGIYVGDEIPMGFGDFKINDPAYATAVMQRSYETVARDINHPSIIHWSIGNEDPLTSLHMASVRTVKGLDPTRPVLMPWRADLWLPPEIDILAPHYITAQENSELAAQSTRPVIMTEFTHAYGNDGFGGLNDRWKALTQHPTGAGGAIWMWADQGLKMVARSPNGSLNGELKVIPDGWDGIVDSYRKPTRDYWETKAVYAQVYPAVDRVSFTQGQSNVDIPIKNEFDFTDLKLVKLRWTLMEDEKELASGSAAMSGQPHTATPYAFPIDAIKNVRPGATYYVRISATGANGVEISKRSVELINAETQVLTKALIGTPTIQTGPDFSVKVGPVAYRFAPNSGQLIAVEADGAVLMKDMRPTIWRTLNANDAGLTKGEVRKSVGDLDKFTASATKWKVTPGPDKVEIEAVTDYTVDQNNRFSVQFRYVVTSDGNLSVHYKLIPAVKAPWLPHVGMAFTAPDGARNLSWLGLGPYDAYPNENVAPILGVWTGTLGASDTAGVKAMRWAELNGAGKRFRLVGTGYLRTLLDDPHTLQILSSVAGRASKGRRPELPSEQMNATNGNSFVGEFSIVPTIRHP